MWLGDCDPWHSDPCGSSSLFRWAYTYGTANFSVGGFDIGHALGHAKVIAAVVKLFGIADLIPRC